MRQDNQPFAQGASLTEFIDSTAGSNLLAEADAAFGRVDFGTAADFLRNRLAATRGIEQADDLAIGDMLEQMMALLSTAASLNSFAVEFYRQSGALKRVVVEIKTFARSPTADNRARLIEAATPLDGLHVRMPPRVRRLLQPFIKRYFWRQELLSYGKLYSGLCDHLKVGVIAG